MNGVNKKIFLDTCILIYLFEETDFSKKAEKVFYDFYFQWFLFEISIISIIEYLTWIKNKKWNLKWFYNKLDKLWIKIIDLNNNYTNIISDLRNNYNLPLPDLICIWQAINNDCNMFITNDKKLKKINEIEILII